MLKDRSISGIICEFNPLHSGHRAILQKMKSQGLVVCVMSGNFVQRGETAIMDKWTRTRLALENGADLVLELPLPFATATAETFAMGGVGILHSLGCVDNLWFGSECGDVNILNGLARLLTTSEYKKALKAQLAKKLSFATAREAAVKSLLGEEYHGELSGSNNILGVEYCKAAYKLNSPIEMHTIKRLGGDHDAYSKGLYMSAMQVRGLVFAKDLSEAALPISTKEAIEALMHRDECPVSLKKLELAVLARLRTMGAENFANLPDISEGLENKLYKASRTAATLEGLYEEIKSKRYSHARARRLVLHAFLGVTASMQTLSYVRILGMSAQGADIIKGARMELPLVGKISDIANLKCEARENFEAEIRADDLFALAAPVPLPCGLDYTKKLIKL